MSMWSLEYFFLAGGEQVVLGIVVDHGLGQDLVLRVAPHVFKWLSMKVVTWSIYKSMSGISSGLTWDRPPR